MTLYDFKVKDYKGNEVSLEQYKGKVLLIIQKKEKPFLFFMQIIANIVNIY